MDESERLKRRQIFVDRHKHELAGLILDGLSTHRSGAEMALWCRGIMYRCDQRLATIFDDMFPPPKPNLSKPADKPPVKT